MTYEEENLQEWKNRDLDALNQNHNKLIIDDFKALMNGGINAMRKNIEEREKTAIATQITKQEIYNRLSEIYKQGKETGCYAASIFNLMSDIKFDIERSEKNEY